MKKIITAFLLILFVIPVCTVNASTERVFDYLRDYGSSDDTFYVEEYPEELFIRISAKKEDVEFGGKYDLVSNRSSIFANMVSEEWFDYSRIYCIMFSENTGYMSFDTFYVKRGIRELSGGTLRPWIIKTESDLPQETKLFLGRVAQELLRYNIDTSVDLEIGVGGEENISIEECAGIAIVRGICEYNGNSYDFTTEFTYESENEWNGTYDTVYVGVNNLDLYGEYTPMEGMEVK